MTDITFITGSTLGGAEYVAEHLAELLTEDGHNTEIENQADLNNIATSGLWIIVCSTHGAGDFPDNFQNFASQIIEQKPDCSELKLAVVGLGDSSYDTFCAAGKKIEQMLVDLGAKLIAPRLDIDVSAHPVPEEPAEIWLEQWKNTL